MRYLCVQCDEEFDSDDDKPRCPKCMRVHGIHPLDDDGKAADPGEDAAAEGGEAGEAATGSDAPAKGDKAAKADKADKPGHKADKPPEEPEGISGGTVAAVAVLVVIAIAAIVISGQDDDEVAGTAVGVEGGGAVSPTLASDAMAKLVASDAAIDAFAAQAADGKAGDARAVAIVEALRAKASGGAYVPWSLAEPRPTAPMTAAEAFAVIAKGDTRAELYPLEVAAVALAAVRSVGVQGKLVEVLSFEGERSPPDPSGRFGYYGVLVGEGESEKLLDPYGGRETTVKPADRMVLSDAQVIAAGQSLRSTYLAQPTGDTAAALRDAEAALSLLPKSPTVRTAHAFALLSSGAGQVGVRELQAAQQQRDDAPRNLNLGFALMAGGQFTSAAKHIARALEIAPDYALGHLNLARLHLAQGDRPLARASLERAEQLDPKMPLISLAWAGYHLTGGELQEALARAESAVEARPDSAEARITLAQVFRSIGRYDDMRKQAKALVDMVSPSQRERTQHLLKATLGPTALEEPEGEAAAGSATPDGGVPDSPSDAFDLTKGSKLLGGGKKPTPSLTGDDVKLKLDL